MGGTISGESVVSLFFSLSYYIAVSQGAASCTQGSLVFIVLPKTHHQASICNVLS